MKIAFDLDGVLCDIDQLHLHIIRGNVTLEKVYYYTRRQLIDPYLWLHAGDEAVIVTSRPYGLKGITEEWLRSHGIHLPLLQEEPCPALPPDWDGIAEWKANIINKENIDLYVDDNPELASRLRKLCKNAVILQYGARSKEVQVLMEEAKNINSTKDIKRERHLQEGVSFEENFSPKTWSHEK